MPDPVVVNPVVEGVVARPDLWDNFIWPSYVLTLAGLIGLLLWAFWSMRAAEKKAEDAKRPRNTGPRKAVQ